MSMTVIPNVCPSSAGTVATVFATSAGFMVRTSIPSTRMLPDVGS